MGTRPSASLAWVRPCVGAQQEADIIKTVQYALDKPGVLTVLGGSGLEDNNRI